jgi:hypothetical protein
MHLPSHSFASLFSLYGSAIATLLPFGVAYAYACEHGWNASTALVLLLSAGVVAALIVWFFVETKLLRDRATGMRHTAPSHSPQPDRIGPTDAKIVSMRDKGVI